MLLSVLVYLLPSVVSFFISLLYDIIWICCSCLSFELHDMFGWVLGKDHHLFLNPLAMKITNLSLLLACCLQQLWEDSHWVAAECKREGGFSVSGLVTERFFLCTAQKKKAGKCLLYWNQRSFNDLRLNSAIQMQLCAFVCLSLSGTYLG